MNFDAVKVVMPEAEVSLLLAMKLVRKRIAQADVLVALDGAQVRLGDHHHFDVATFMTRHGWRQVAQVERWQGRYVATGIEHAIEIHSNPGLGDVTTVLAEQRLLVVESKKGGLTPSKSSSEYKLMREALGQLLTLEQVPENVVLAIAVPHGDRFIKLAERWRKAPLIVRCGILIVTVACDGSVHGLDI